MKNVLTTFSFFLVLTISVKAQVGKVGINTTTPAAMLHVKDSSVVFTGGVINGSPPPVSGAGVRMMWYAQRAAFRAGYVDGNQWDRDNTGQHSFATGSGTKASGSYSFAAGLNSVADGYISFAMGNGVNVPGTASFATGNFTRASGGQSFAIGVNSIASGTTSFASGWDTKASQIYSSAAGFRTIANTNCLFAIGRYNDTTSLNSDWSDSDQLFAVGNGTSHGNRKNALTVLKGGNVGIGVKSPDNTLDIRRGSPRLEGHASERPLYVTGDLEQDANGIEFRGNDGTQGIGFGYNTIYATGYLDDQDLGMKARGSAGILKFITNDTARMRITGNGKVGIGLMTNPTPNEMLEIGGSGRAFFGTGEGVNRKGFLIDGIETNAARIEAYNYDTNTGMSLIINIAGQGKVGIGTPTPSEKLHVVGNGLFTGTVTASCGMLTCSDIRYKTNIKPIVNALQNVNALHGITYDWNNEKFPEKEFNGRHQIGISAQELEKVYPEMVFTDASGYKTVDYSRLAPVLIEAVKEQQQQIDELTQQVKELLEISRESTLAKKP